MITMHVHPRLTDRRTDGRTSSSATIRSNECIAR